MSPTGFSIFKKVILSFATTTTFISSFRYISFTGLRPLAGSGRLQKGFLEYYP
jgi:hypothetical protein